MRRSDAERRAIIRQVVARQLVRPGANVANVANVANATNVDDSADACREHPSHATLPAVRSANARDACLTEPVVRCGYCQSYGH